MNPLISATVVGDEQLVRQLRALTPAFRGQLRQKIEHDAMRLTRHVKSDKLSGQVLNVRTGRLRRSIHPDVKDTETGVMAQVGTNVVYARVHEYGFDGEVTVRAHLRTIKQAWGRSMRQPKQVMVKQYSYHMKMPERSFLRSSLHDMAPELRKNMISTIASSIRAVGLPSA